ncbi:Thioesterase/thiol ester dehydrase-isomerase [Atractiella rhizophila]|nr:Thioesterase/thiol ester dehydrase-isomerase [Atractiella rhizophila]
MARRLEPDYYQYFVPFSMTKWSDNDNYQHMNNAKYLEYFDSIVNEFLINHCSLDPTSQTEPIGLVVSVYLTYASSLSFPSPLLAGLAISKLGRSSVTYHVALFEAEKVAGDIGFKNANGSFSLKLKTGKAACYGEFIHVYVDPKSRKAVQIPDKMRKAMNDVTVSRS